MKMLGNLAVRCSYGCCRVDYNHKRRERRNLKRSERNAWKRELIK